MGDTRWPTPHALAEIRPLFDSNLSFDITQSGRMRPGREGMPITLVKDYVCELWRDGDMVWSHTATNNRRRNPVISIPTAVGPIDRVRLEIRETWGSEYARVFAIRCQTKV